ncbi:FAD-dependent oxidoreductase [Paludibacter sp.]
MKTELQLILTPEQAYKEDLLKLKIAEKLSIISDRISHYRILKRSIDARSSYPKINIAVEVFIDKAPETNLYTKESNYQNVTHKEPVLIIGSGPAGLFAALKLLELGMKPIIIERGKASKKRILDIASLNRNKGFNPESNFCFGAGGAGTFSDGKLYTRSKKKGNTQDILEVFHFHGAHENILYEAHPHIGSDLLPDIISNMVETVEKHGGEVYFEKKLTEILIVNNQIIGCKTEDGTEYKSRFLILATGHSAHDIYELLYKESVKLEPKGFAMGVRVEHPQSLIDSIQYHSPERDPYLPAANYALVEQVKERGVYSFCMCPGGRIVPAGSNAESIVVNGMSASKRNSPYANSGIVVEIRTEDIPEEFNKFGVLAGLRYQQHLEHLAYLENGGQGQKAPAQRLLDFVKGVQSVDLPECSYLPGIVTSSLHKWLPVGISSRLKDAFKLFDKKMKGFLTNEAVIVGVESRSSSAVRIPRDPNTGEHPDIKGLFPAGEGSGYSGGITSSAIDGENAAIHVFSSSH